MNVRVIKGTNQIGGCITEISSSKAKIIIDFGEDLPNEDIEEIKEINIDGLTNDNISLYDAVFITHNHGDHIGLIHKIHKNIDIYIEETAYEIFKISNAFTTQNKINNNIKTFKFEEIIKIKDIMITPYQTDHSAYNSSMFLIESKDKRILHLGDYRANGYSSKKLFENLRKIKNKGEINLLITEGTSINRHNKKNLTEENLKQKAINIFNKYDQIFIYQASTNIDRIKTFYDAACECNKNFILDVSSANILKVINNKDLNYLDKSNVSVWISNVYNDKKSKFYEYKEKDFYEKYISPLQKYKNTYSVHKPYVMLVKASMLKDIEYNLRKYRNNAHLIYSLWEGYLDEGKKENKKTIEFIKKLNQLNIKKTNLHTSGHADIPTMKKVREILNPQKTYGIHTENNQKLEEIFLESYELITDNEINEI